MKNKYPLFYFLSLLLVLAAAAYPLYRAVLMLEAFFRQGHIEAANYPKYIIPYAPVSLALVLAAVFMPLFYKLFRRYTLPAASFFGVLVFLCSENYLERIPVLTGYAPETALPVESWQYSLCIATPQVLQSVGEPAYAEGNPAFKVHFYLIAILIILAVIYLLYGYTKMIKTGRRDRRRPLAAQLVCTVIFIGLCVWACLTAFYRTGDIRLAPVSALLTSLFFVVFGATFGVYTGCMLYAKGGFLSVFVPSVLAMATAAAMYWGEYVLMGGELFILGRGEFFRSVPGFAFAPADAAVVLASGFITALILMAIGGKKRPAKTA